MAELWVTQRSAVSVSSRGKHADTHEGAFLNDLFKEIIKEKQLRFIDMKYQY